MNNLKKEVEKKKRNSIYKTNLEKQCSLYFEMKRKR